MDSVNILSDEQLKLLCRKGDYSAFEQLYHRHKDALFRFVFRQCGNEETSKDLFQDIWLNIHRACGNYSPDAKFTTWLYRIAHNKIIDYYRKTGKESLLSYEEQLTKETELIGKEPQLQPESLILELQLSECLLNAIKSLKEAQREVALLHFEMGFSVSEIAEITQVNAETIKSRLRYAMNTLRKHLKQKLN